MKKIIFVLPLMAMMVVGCSNPTNTTIPVTPTEPATPAQPEQPQTPAAYSAGDSARANITFDGVTYSKTGEVYVTGPSGATITGAANTNNYAGVFIEGRNVTLSPYIMGKYEVTQQLYTAIMTNQTVTVGETEYTLEASPFRCKETGRFPKVTDENQDLRPAENITWFDAVYFCNRLSEKMSLTPAYNIRITTINDSTNGHITAATVSLVSNANGYRLPTVAEWEFAARGGNPSATAWNYTFSGAATAENTDWDAEQNTGIDNVGWYKYNLGGGATNATALRDGNAGYGTHEVGTKAENALHIFDMSGNVFELCYDWFENTPETGTVTNPTGATSGTFRSGCGGSWREEARYCTVCFHDFCIVDGRGEGLGFRVVRNTN